MNENTNPFPTKNYISKELFCDREIELDMLLRNAKNNTNTTLISARRIGKTGLIHRFFEYLAENNSFETVYIDIYASRNLGDFVTLMAEAILTKFPEKTSIGKQFVKLLRGFRPLFSLDELTGSPQIQFNYQSAKDKEYTLQRLLAFLENQQKPVIVAIVEFQEIAFYPEKNVEAILRTQIQQLKNIQFVFCGSRKHILAEIFLSAKRPFFASTQFINLEPINREIYKHFILKTFEKGKRTIDNESLDLIMDWTKGYTFYTQSLCSKLYYHKKIDVKVAKYECNSLLKENESVFLQYRKLITTKQWDFLVALAKEESITQVYTNNFLNKYNLGTPSTANRILKSLVDKELILESISPYETNYCVYDVFLMRWLQATY